MTPRHPDDLRRQRLRWLGVVAVGAAVVVGWILTLPQTLSPKGLRRTLLDELRASGDPQLGATVARLRGSWQQEQRALLGAITSTPDGATVDGGGRFFFRLPAGWEAVVREDGRVVGRSASGTLEVRYPTAVTDVASGTVEPLTVDGLAATMVSDGTMATVVAKRPGGYLLVRMSSPNLDLGTVRELVASIHFTRQP